MTEWKWIAPDLVFAIHGRQIAEHGGLEGIRDPDAVAAAISRPQHLATYGDPPPDVFDLAAAYCWGMVRNHGFSDGNKRTGWILARLFLADHGVRIAFDKIEAVRKVEDAAAGVLLQDALAAWFRSLER